MDFLRSNKSAQWVVPIGLGLFSCVCSCAPMMCLFMTVVMPIDTTGMPPDQAFQMGLELGQQASAGQQLYSLSMYCVPPFLLVAVGLVSFFLVRGYQQRNAPPAPPPSAPPSV